MSTSEPGWLPDPTGRHEYRWWEGAAWSDVVADGGVESSDPIAVYQQQHQAASNAHWPGATGGIHTSGRGTSNRETYSMLAVVGVAIVALLAVLFVVLREDGGNGETATGAEPRAALTQFSDMPDGWAQTEEDFARREELICEQRPEPAEPPREIEVGFDRSSPSGALTHRIIEYTPDFAAELLDEATRQADVCGTWDEESESGGVTESFTATSSLITGSTYGDETVWYVIHLEFDGPSVTVHDVLICLDRHGGVVSGFTLSTASPTSSEDRALVEELAQTASDRLDGGGTE